MATVGKQIGNLSAYLGVVSGKVTFDGEMPTVKGRSGTRKGLVSIAKHLVRAAERTTLLGESPEDQAAVDQWLEYRVNHVDRCPSEKEVHTVLKELDTYLSDKVYMLNHKLSLADILLYYGLSQTFLDLTFLDKQRYMHISRWFDNVQHVPGLRQTLPPVAFSRNKLYTSLTVH